MKIKIGTRKSALAMKQTQIVVKMLQSEFSDINFEIVPIVTQGDKILDRPLSLIGGKGLFICEIEKALLSGEIDIAVHSAKDLPGKIDDNFEIPAVIDREFSMGFAEDVFVFPKEKEYKKTDSFVVGTGSQRRKLQFKKFYPNAQFKDIRGNVGTRIEKMLRGEYDALILARAGLFRLGFSDDKRINFRVLDKNEFIPASCQGIIAIECMKNSAVSELVHKICCEKTMKEFKIMREISEKFGSDCTLPLGIFAKINQNKFNLKATLGRGIFDFESDYSDYKCGMEKCLKFLGSD